MKYHLFSFIVCHKEVYELYFKEIKGETYISYFQHSSLLLQCHLLLPYFCPCPPAFPTYMLSSDRISVEKPFFFMMKYHPALLLEGIAPCSPVWLGWVQWEGSTKHTLPSHPAPHTATQTNVQDISGRSICWQMIWFYLVKNPPCCAGAEPSKWVRDKGGDEFKHKCNNKNQHKASLRTEREITWSEGGTLPPLLFFYPISNNIPFLLPSAWC